jgi:hypothetical protein
MLVAAICLMTAILTATIISSAASPSNGTLSPSGGALTYTGGPFANDNQSAPTSDVSPQCVGTTLPCDDYALTVSIPAGTTTSYNVNVNIGWIDTGGTTSDFDLFIFKSDGTRLTFAATSSNPEEVAFPAVAGSYTVRVVPYSTSHTVKYNGTIQLIPVGGGGPSGSPTPTPVPTPVVPGAPRFQSYLSPAGVADDFGEPSIGANWLSGNIMTYGGFGDPVRVTFDDCPSPAKATWVTTPAITANTTRALGDPILYTDRETGRTLVSQLEGGSKQSTTDYTDDDGAHYLPTQGSGVNSGVDHQTLGGGPFGAASTLPHPTYQNAVYYCAQDVADANCAVSLDGGVTFGPAVPMYNATQCGGLHGHVKVAPDGTVYVPNRGCGGQPVGTPVTAREYQGVAVSTNNGITWSVKPVTGSKPNSNDPSVGIGADGTVYFVYADGDNHPKVQVSHDKGTTWSTAKDVGAPFGIVNTAFPVAVGGDANRAAVGFIGTSATGNPNDAATFRGIWHAYVAMTYDGGATWTTVDTTPDDPVQIGSVCLSGTTCGTDRNLLDFNDMTVDRFGRPLMVYADGCVAPACTTATAAGNPPYNASRSSKGAIARQSGGRRLFAQYDPNPAEPTLPAAPRVNSVERNALGTVHLDWSEPDNGGSALIGYNVYRKAGANGSYAPLATGLTRTTYDDTTATAPNTTYFYKVTATNGIGEGTNCGEFSPSIVTQESRCELPGVTAVTDTSDGGQNTPPDARVDIQKVFVAEPFFGAGVNKLVITMKMAPSTMTTAQPNGEWYTIWNRLQPDANFDRYYVAMKSDSGGAVTYEYGKFGVPLATDGSIPNPNSNTPVKLGDADGGTYSPTTGVITITLATSKAENIQPGQSLGGLNARTYFTRPAVGPRSQNIASDITGDGAYQLAGNAACAPNTAPLASLLAAPTSGNVPLTVGFNGAGSSDSDAGDSVASYTFNFGDGTAPVTQASPTIQHVYNQAGQFAARLTVTDTHGQVSSNMSEVIITVNDPSVRQNYAFSGNGGTATGSSEHESGGFPALSAINGDRTGGNWGGGTGGWNDGTRGVFPDSLVVSFNGSRTIDEIRLYTLQNNFRSAVEPTPSMTCDYYGLIDFDVQTWDGAQWVTIPGGNVTGNNNVMRVFTFPAVTTTKIRVVVNNAQNNYSRIVELEAFGAGGQ